MQLCIDCIKVLKEDLSEQSVEVLNEISDVGELSERDLSRQLPLKHTHIKKILYELKSKLLLKYNTQGRSKVYELTESGNELLKLNNKSISNGEENKQVEANEKVEVDKLEREEKEDNDEIKGNETKKMDSEQTEKLVWDFE